MRFEWDGHKRIVNIEKHGIDFVDIPELFDGPMLTQLDTRQYYDEDRWIGLGILRGFVVVVVYVEWEDEDNIRIISARRATQNESKNFHRRISH